MKRPEFDDFRELFLECLGRDYKIDPLLCNKKQWLDLGDEECRRNILESLNKELQEKYGVEFDINRRLLGVNGPVESAIIQTFHELSTINIMARINAKILARRANQLN
ncbi:MAG: hypothetical protein PHP51_00205 [Desulfotomaculaceae bacterium]|nr:hypothetical protein [Desulfotomaculaceae bacterium]MDD4766452.1 hypothetical protein [Desulfotomaculaceae bacterium]